MKNPKLGITIIITGAFLFNLLFWQEQVAINCLVFDLFIVTSLFCLYPDAKNNRIVKYLLAAHLICIAAVIINNTMLSKLAMGMTLLLFFAFAEYSHRSAWFAGGSMVINFTLFVAGFSSLLRTSNLYRKRNLKLGKLIRFAVFPLFIVAVFFVIYNFANNIFSGIVADISNKVGQFFSSFFELISIERLLFLLAGMYLTGALLVRATGNKLEQSEAALSDNLLRIRENKRGINSSFLFDIVSSVMGRLAKGMMALKNENTVGLISLGLLNLLLVIVNTIDINYLWFNFTYHPGINLTTMIHEGTELLILSLVLAIIVLLFFFRGNLNFYQRNKWLKIGAYAWLLQNGILVVSVLIRDYYYIKLMGLAYKRIGVLVFLILTLTGLITVFIKITWRKTAYYLMRVNAWSVIILFVIGTTINWDVLIAKYNISHSDRITLDLPFLLTLSDRTLPVLDQHIDVLKKREYELNREAVSLGNCNGCIEKILRNWKDNYLQKQQQYSWLSWNYADAATIKYFDVNHNIIAGKK